MIGIMKKTLLCLVMLLCYLPAMIQAEELVYDRNDVMPYHVQLPDGVKQGLMQVVSGRWIVLPQYDWIYDFEVDNTAMVEINGKYGLIDTTGKLVIAPRFEQVGHFVEGLAAVKESGKYGFVDKSDKMIILPQYEYVSGFSDGLCAVYWSKKWGYINKAGKIVVEPQYDMAHSFSQGRAAVKQKDKWGFIDTAGRVIIEPIYEEVYPFTEGLAAVKRDGLWGYINLNGEIIIPLKYRGGYGAWCFTEGLAAVCIDGKYGFINNRGEVVILPQFDITIPFREERALIEIDNSWGFIDKQGKIIVPPELDRFAQRPAMYENGFAAVAYHNKIGVLDKNGNWVVQPTDEGVKKFYPKHNLVLMSYFDWEDRFTSECLVDINGQRVNHYINHMQDGYMYFREENYSAAITAFEKALAINPNDEGALWGISRARSKITEKAPVENLTHAEQENNILVFDNELVRKALLEDGYSIYRANHIINGLSKLDAKLQPVLDAYLEEKRIDEKFNVEELTVKEIMKMFRCDFWVALGHMDKAIKKPEAEIRLKKSK